MRYLTTLLIMTLAATAVLAGCGGDDSTQQSGGDSGADGALADGGASDSGSPDGASGDSAGGDSGPDSSADGGTPDSGGDGGVGDGGDGGTSDSGTLTGKTAMGLTSGGAVSHSPNYTLIGTLAQSPGGNNTSKSTNYQIRGGVVGATQKP